MQGVYPTCRGLIRVAEVRANNVVKAESERGRASASNCPPSGPRIIGLADKRKQRSAIRFTPEIKFERNKYPKNVCRNMVAIG